MSKEDLRVEGKGFTLKGTPQQQQSTFSWVFRQTQFFAIPGVYTAESGANPNFFPRLLRTGPSIPQDKPFGPSGQAGQVGT